jgi:hypothetical protein
MMMMPFTWSNEYPDPQGIPKEFAVRNNFSISDFIATIINPNDDGQNFEFIVQHW